MGFNPCWSFALILRSNAAERVTFPCHACPQASTASVGTESELVWVRSILGSFSSNLNSLIRLTVWSHQCLCWCKGRCIERKGMHKQGKDSSSCSFRGCCFKLHSNSWALALNLSMTSLQPLVFVLVSSFSLHMIFPPRYSAIAAMQDDPMSPSLPFLGKTGRLFPRNCSLQHGFVPVPR